MKWLVACSGPSLYPIQFYGRHMGHLATMCSRPQYNIHIHTVNYVLFNRDIDGLAQDCSNPIANALELLQACTGPSIYWCVEHFLEIVYIYLMTSWLRNAFCIRTLHMGKPTLTCGLPRKGPVTRSSDVFFNVCWKSSQVACILRGHDARVTSL